MTDIIQGIDSFLADPVAATGARSLLIVVLALLAIWLGGRLTSRLDDVIRSGNELGPTEGEKRLRTLANVVRYALTTLIVVVALIMLLRETGIDVAPLLAGAGISAVIIGFGAQNLVRDLVAGVFVLTENQYGVGDVVQVAGVTGRVEKITLRMTRMRDLSGSVHVVPNGEITVVTNFTKEWAKAMLDVGVAYKESVDRVMEVLADVGAGMSDDETWGPRLLEPLKVMGVQGFEDSAVTIRVSFRTVPDMRWDVARELRRRIKNRFDAEGIEIPFPHRTLYVGSGDSGRLQVDVDGGRGRGASEPADEARETDASAAAAAGDEAVFDG